MILTNSHQKPVSSIGFDRNEIIRNHLERMSIKTDAHRGIDRCVDDSQAVLLSGCQSDNVVGSASSSVLVLAIDEDIVR
jgi:hypothetical protein